MENIADLKNVKEYPIFKNGPNKKKIKRNEVKETVRDPNEKAPYKDKKTLRREMDEKFKERRDRRAQKKKNTLDKKKEKLNALGEYMTSFKDKVDTLVKQEPVEHHFYKQIKNKIVRSIAYHKKKNMKKNEKKKLKAMRKKDPNYKKMVPRTIENSRIETDTMIKDAEDIELLAEESSGPYAMYNKSYEPKTLVTVTDHVHARTIAFVRDLGKILPNCVAKPSSSGNVRSIVKTAVTRGFTDVVIVNEDRRMPDGILLIHLPDGPTAQFRVSSIRTSFEVHRNKEKVNLSCRPEVLLTNFKTQTGKLVSKMLGGLFYYEPEFKGQRVCVFHNQRDFIFFRHHRYAFDTTTKNGKINLKAVGPEFTLKLQWIVDGVLEGDCLWELKSEMDNARRKFEL